METQLLRRSDKGLRAQIVTIGVVALLIGIIGSSLIGFVFSWAPNTERFLTIALWVASIGLWAFQSLSQWLGWKAKRYEIGPEAIGVYTKAGMWGSATAYYRYESIISVRMTQGFWGKRYNFGDVHISIPKLERDVVLRDIDRPTEQLAELQGRMNERAGNSSHLVT